MFRFEQRQQKCFAAFRPDVLLLYSIVLASLAPGVAGQGQLNTERIAFLQSFRQLPPTERLEVWKRSLDTRGKSTLANQVSAELRTLLIAEGVDAVPQLARIIRDRTSSMTFRLQAMEVLATMDRWVPQSTYSQLPVEPAVWFSVAELRIDGTRSLFLDVNGRRIGKEGMDALTWASQQSGEELIRFQAWSLTGLLEKDLRALSLEEQIGRWRNAEAQNAGRDSRSHDDRSYQISNCLRRILIERAPDSIPLLVSLLESERNPFVREEIIRIFQLIDARRFRLRSSLAGQDAIEAIHGALARGNLKPTYDTDEKRETGWERLRQQFYEDEFDLELNSTSDWIIFANALERWFGDRTTEGTINRFSDLKKLNPDFLKFLAFLTRVDPFFPSWEYTFDGPVIKEQVLHPLFRKKAERYHEAWTRFNSQNRNVAGLSALGIDLPPILAQGIIRHSRRLTSPFSCNTRRVSFHL